MDDLTAREVADWAYEHARLELMSRFPAVPTHRPILFDDADEKRLTKEVTKEEKKRLAALAKEEKKRIAAWEKAYKASQRFAAAEAKKMAKKRK